MDRGIACEPTVVKKPEVFQALEYLFSTINRCEGLLPELSEKLDSVITGAPTQSEEKASKDQAYNTSLANDINMARGRVREIADYIESLLGRIEL